jgi:hypothetical protein
MVEKGNQEGYWMGHPLERTDGKGETGKEKQTTTKKI